MNLKLRGKTLRPHLLIWAFVLASPCNCLPHTLARSIGTAQSPRVQARGTEGVRHRAGNPPEAGCSEVFDPADEVFLSPNQVRSEVARANLRHVRERHTGRA